MLDKLKYISVANKECLYLLLCMYTTGEDAITSTEQQQPGEDAINSTQQQPSEDAINITQLQQPSADVASRSVSAGQINIDDSSPMTNGDVIIDVTANERKCSSAALSTSGPPNNNVGRTSNKLVRFYQLLRYYIYSIQ